MLGFASLVTLGIIFSFVFVIVLLAGNLLGYLDMPVIIGLTILINVMSWLISPFMMDLMFRWFYQIRRLTLEELEQRSPRVGAFIRKTCEKYHFNVPAIRLILDDNPTAFTFGSGAWNARLCFSEGLFTYLSDEEIEAVLAHELGHIRRRDFIIMTIASTAVQVLYELSQLLLRSRRGGDRDRGALVWVGFLAYAFYFVGTYLLLFLSRTREHGADEFAAHEIENPDALSKALVKIAYGIVAKPDDEGQKRLLHSTRALGPYDYRSASHLGTAFHMQQNNWPFIAQVLAYDLVSPWAKILEFASTHPLTGKRIIKLNAFTKQKGKSPSIDTDMARSVPVDRERLYRGFIFGVFIYFLPWVSTLGVVIAAVATKNPNMYLWIPAAFGAAIILQILYKYPSTPPQKTTVISALTDLYASPITGVPYALEGKIIGRGMAGAKLSEDLMMQDGTGLIYLNYESAFSFLGNLMFALGKVRKLVGKTVQCSGWFFRSIGHHFDLRTVDSEEGHIRSHPKLWGMIFGVVLMGVSLYLASTPSDFQSAFGAFP